MARHRRRRGFTLLELVIVMALLAAILLVFTRVAGDPGGARALEGASSQLAGLLRAARSRAILNNRPAWVLVDLAGNRVLADSGDALQLSADTHLSLLAARSQIATAQAGRIVFEPDGSSSGGRIMLAGHGRTMIVGIDWLAGKVTVQP
jgi:general secretion pathway protein H